MPAKLRFFSQVIPTWQVRGVYSVNLKSTAINTTLATKLQDIIGMDFKEDWRLNPAKYMLFTTVQSQAGGTNFLTPLFINGTTEGAANATLAYGSFDNYRIAWDGTGEVRVFPVVMINDNGDMRFNVKYDTAWNTNMYIKSFILFEIVE